jgi:NADH-quinone oxidoreductase subunit A
VADSPVEAKVLTQFGYIGLFAVAAFVFALSMIIIPVFLRYAGVISRRPNAVKNSPFECGMETTGKTQVRFNFRYYFYALLFIALDVLVLFIYPWAVGLRQFGFFGLFMALFFIFIVGIGWRSMKALLSRS